MKRSGGSRVEVRVQRTRLKDSEFSLRRARTARGRPNLGLTVVKDKYAAGLLIPPKRIFVLPSPSAGSSEAVAHSCSDITALALAAKTDGKEPMATAAPDSQITARISAL